MDMNESKDVERRLIKVVATKLHIDEKSITLASRFQEDLGADSLDIVELLMAIEDEFKITIPEDDAERMKTMDDAVKAIQAKI